MVRYDVGDFFGLHHDANTLTFRTVSAVALLPSDFDGGELTFFARRLPAGLTAGDVVLFPSNFLFSHAVSPVTRGVRYSIVTWMR
ncbi:MAG: 2OG-Fe(II) oxygenase [Acidimicrobiales bacterium]